MIEELWKEYDQNNNGVLEEGEAREFFKKTLGNLIDQDDKKQSYIADMALEEIFKGLDKDGEGYVVKESMVNFLKEAVVNAKKERGYEDW